MDLEKPFYADLRVFWLFFRPRPPAPLANRATRSSVRGTGVPPVGSEDLTWVMHETAMTRKIRLTPE